MLITGLRRRETNTLSVDFHCQDNRVPNFGALLVASSSCNNRAWHPGRTAKKDRGSIASFTAVLKPRSSRRVMLIVPWQGSLLTLNNPSPACRLGRQETEEALSTLAFPLDFSFSEASTRHGVGMHMASCIAFITARSTDLNYSPPQWSLITRALLHAQPERRYSLLPDHLGSLKPHLKTP